jgi:hypothetical protein
LPAAGDLAVDTGDIDIAWELDGHLLVMDFVEEPPSPEGARAMMPTLNEEDPLRYDLAYRREHAARDSMPTFPDIDPLSYDVPD